jgi:hypothetical protein
MQTIRFFNSGQSEIIVDINRRLLMMDDRILEHTRKIQEQQIAIETLKRRCISFKRTRHHPPMPAIIVPVK